MTPPSKKYSSIIFEVQSEKRSKISRNISVTQKNYLTRNGVKSFCNRKDVRRVKEDGIERPGANSTEWEIHKPGEITECSPPPPPKQNRTFFYYTIKYKNTRTTRESWNISLPFLPKNCQKLRTPSKAWSAWPYYHIFPSAYSKQLLPPPPPKNPNWSTTPAPYPLWLPPYNQFTALADAPVWWSATKEQHVYRLQVSPLPLLKYIEIDQTLHLLYKYGNGGTLFLSPSGSHRTRLARGRSCISWTGIGIDRSIKLPRTHGSLDEGLHVVVHLDIAIRRRVKPFWFSPIVINGIQSDFYILSSV